MQKTAIVTDCGHQYNTPYPAETLSGVTTDCRVCDRLLIFPQETTIGRAVRARDFNQYLHEGNPSWPADGRGTGYIEFGHGVTSVKIAYEDL